MDATTTPSDVKRPEAILMSSEQVAALLSCSTRHIRRLADRNALPKAIRLGSLVRWRREDIDAWVAAGCPSKCNGGNR